MNKIDFKNVIISNDFFFELQELNANITIISQWEQLEETGCINNFRIIADHNDSFFREGYFFADSDAYKWLDAACRIQQNHPSNVLKNKIDFFSDLIIRTQEPDGYIFTYNQIHFPGQRWKNLLLEHELYCLGHLIEAGISHFQINNEKTLLNACSKVADLLVKEFLHNRSSTIPGHEEIELALFKLFSIIPNENYLTLAIQFIENRGKLSFIGLRFFKHSLSTGRRMRGIEKLRKKFYETNQCVEINLPENVKFPMPKGIKRKSLFNFVSGKYLQSHEAIRKQNSPEGHAVRFSYLKTASTMFAQLKTEPELVRALELSWQHMVTKKMFVTGGIGQIPVTEGFDKDYQLDPTFAYCESCAGIGSMLWNWQMTQLTHKAWYADLFEWQMYNAVLVGLGKDGKSYFYRNPSETKNDYGRKKWYKVPCCPSNISRTIASLGEYIFTCNDNEIWIHQYISADVKLPLEEEIKLSLSSSLPYDGHLKIQIQSKKAKKVVLHLRIPSWVNSFSVQIDQNKIETHTRSNKVELRTASGYNPFLAYYFDLELELHKETEIFVNFFLEINLVKPDPKVSALKGKSTITRGPLVYCLEQFSNSFDIFSTNLKPNKLIFNDNTKNITTETHSGNKAFFIPYFLWANEKSTKMTIFANLSDIIELDN